MKKKAILIGSSLPFLLLSCGEEKSTSDSNLPADLTITTASYSQKEGVINLSSTFYKVKEFVSGQTYLIGALQNNTLKAIGLNGKGCRFTYTLKSGGSSTSTPSSSLTYDGYTLEAGDLGLSLVSVENGNLTEVLPPEPAISEPLGSEEVQRRLIPINKRRPANAGLFLWCFVIRSRLHGDRWLR